LAQGSAALSDVLVLGAGHNGLVAAFYLARAGLRVNVLESRSEIGGACKTEELIEGYRFSTCANFLWALRPVIAQDLRLFKRGLVISNPGPRTRIMDGNRGFTYWEEPDALSTEIRPFSSQDSDAWFEWNRLWLAAAELLGPYLLSYPPSEGELYFRARRRGQERLLDQLLSTSLADLADHYFESEEMRGGVEAPIGVGSLYERGSSLMQGMQSAVGYYSSTGEPFPRGFVRGGMGTVTRLMAEAARSEGAAIRTNATIDRIVVEGQVVRGVELIEGEQIRADIVISNADVKRTFRHLLRDAPELTSLRRKVNSLTTEVVPLKLHCAVSELPEFAAFPDSHAWSRGPLVLQENRRHHEDAWREARAGLIPKHPYMQVMVPSVADPTLAPAGHHTVSVWALFAPKVLAEGSWPARREEAADGLVQTLEGFAPGFESKLVDRILLTPWDIEEHVGLTDGHIYHIDLSPGQILARRPLPELARYRTPVEGLYLCGAGQHPYGEVCGAPGYNAAHAVLDDVLKLDGGWQEIEHVE
jgi:phytoene dehydrogenase-like protein